MTHLLHALGAAVPPDTASPGYGNPLGHWEPRALVAINDAILSSLGRAWDDPRPMPDRWFSSRAAYDFLRQITNEIHRGYDDAPLIVMKDPRLCRLLPLYLEALNILDIEPLIILVARPLPEIARSLTDRDGLDPAHTELLWLRSMTEAEQHSRGCRRVWVGYGQLIADWGHAASRIAAELGFSWPTPPHELGGGVDRIIRPRLRYTEEMAGALACASGLADAAWNAISRGLEGDDPAARAGFDQVRAALRQMDRLYVPAFAGLCRQHETALQAVYASTSWRLTAPLRSLRQWVVRRRGRQSLTPRLVRPVGLEPTTERL